MIHRPRLDFYKARLAEMDRIVKAMRPRVLRVKATQPTASGSVDRPAGVLRAFKIASFGKFKTPDRGQFDRLSLATIVKLINGTPGGVRSRFGHPGFLSDGIGTYLGRVRDAKVVGDHVRADLHFAKAAALSPLGDLPRYVMALLGDDPGAMGSSLVLRVTEEQAPNRLEPPVWRPTEILAADLVDEGDAVHGSLLNLLVVK